MITCLCFGKYLAKKALKVYFLRKRASNKYHEIIWFQRGKIPLLPLHDLQLAKLNVTK